MIRMEGNGQVEYFEIKSGKAILEIIERIEDKCLIPVIASFYNWLILLGSRNSYCLIISHYKWCLKDHEDHNSKKLVSYGLPYLTSSWSLLGFCDCGDKVFSFPFMLMMLLPSHGEDQQTPRQTISSQTVMMTMTDDDYNRNREKGIVFNTFRRDLRVRVECSASPWIRLCYGLRERETWPNFPSPCHSPPVSIRLLLRKYLFAGRIFGQCSVRWKIILLSPQADWWEWVVM